MKQKTYIWKRAISLILALVLLCSVTGTYTTPVSAASRVGVDNPNCVTGDDIVAEARSWAGTTATYWSGSSPWPKCIAWRTGYTTDGQTSFDCSGFVSRVLNDLGLRGQSIVANYDCVLREKYGAYFIDTEIAKILNYGEDITSAVQKAKNGDYSELVPGDLIGWVGDSQLGNHIIIYAGMKNGTPWMVEFTGSGYLDCAVTSQYQAAFQSGARLVEQSDVIEESYPSYVVIQTPSAAKLWNMPCSDKTSDDAVHLYTTSAGEHLRATALYLNSQGNYWYRVNYNGSTCYVYAGNTTFVLADTADLTISGVVAPSNIQQGKSFVIDGTIATSYSEIVEVSAKVCVANSGEVKLSSAVSTSTQSYRLKSSTIDKQLTFNTLSNGSYSYSVSAKNKQYFIDNEGRFASAILGSTLYSADFTVGASDHTCNYGEFAFYEEVHPHYKCYTCTVCGKVNRNYSETVHLNSCAECRPGKPVLSVTTDENGTATFTWNATSNTTHYNVWVSKQSADGNWSTVGRFTYAESGITCSLDEGEYRAQLQAYDSNHWEDDGSDWVHTLSDDVYFTIEPSIQATPIELFTYTYARVENGGDTVYYEFIPWINGEYTIHSITDLDTIVTLYDSDFNALYSDDDSGPDRNFSLTCDLEEGETYYYGVGYYSASQTGEIPVVLYAEGENANIELNEEYSCTIESGDGLRYYAFTVPDEGYLPIYAVMDINENAGVALMDQNHVIVSYLDHEIRDKCYSIPMNLEENTTYYLGLDHIPGVATSATFQVSTVEQMPEFWPYAKTIENGGDMAIYWVCPQISGTCTMQSFSDQDVCVTLYDSDLNQLASDDDSGPDLNFQLSYELDAHEMYYIGVRYYNDSKTGDIPVVFHMEGTTHVSGELPTEGHISLEPGAYTYLQFTTPESGVNNYSVRFRFDGFDIANDADVAMLLLDKDYVTVGVLVQDEEDPGSLVLDSDQTELESGMVYYAIFYNYGDHEELAYYSISPAEPDYRCGDNLTWSLSDDGVLTISGTGPMWDYSDDSPAPWFGSCSAVTSVIIEDGVTSIGDYAFNRCVNMTSVEIPNSVGIIDFYAFGYCSSLTSIVIPESVYFINGAFAYCHSLTEICVDEDNETYLSDDRGVLIDKKKTCLIYAPEAISGHYTIPNSVTEIGHDAFYGCCNLTGITIPDSVNIINQNAFVLCTGLTSMEIPASVSLICNAVFHGCTNLTDVTFRGDAPIFEDGAFSVAEFNAHYPSDNLTWTSDVMQDYGGTITWVPYGSATEVASGYSGDITWRLTDDGILTFSGEGKMKNYEYKSEMPWYSYMNQIESVVIEDGVTSIGDYAFYGFGITSIEIPESVTSIGAFAFKNAASLDNVVLPSGLTKLGESAFYACTSLSSIEIPAKLWTIQPYTFKNCTALSNVTFNEGNLEKISDGAFYNTALISVELPDCLDILDSYVFKNCAQLAEVKLSASLTQIREASLYGTAISSIEIPEGVTSIKPYAFKNCVNLVYVSLPETLTIVDEAAFYACTELETLDLPDAVTTIGDYAFRKCAGLTTVSFGGGLVTIGESSFYGCAGISVLSIPRGVTTIKGYAFKGCTNLTDVILPTTLTTLGESAFHTCTALSEIIIPAKVSTIGAYCFSGSTGIKTIEFLGNAPTIGDGAFNKITAIAWYPGDNITWTSSKMQNYGGSITWKAQS